MRCYNKTLQYGVVVSLHSAYWMTFVRDSAYIGVGNIVGKNIIAEALKINCGFFTYEPTLVSIASNVMTSWVFDLGTYDCPFFVFVLLSVLS